MKTVLAEERLVIVDGFMTKDDLAAAASDAVHTTYRDVEIDSEHSIWLHNAPLNPQVGPTIIWTEIEEYKDIVAALPGVLSYPTGKAFDRVLTVARQIAVDHGLFGEAEKNLNEYAGVIASLYRYKPGCRLVWHLDEAYLGAFSAYISDDWSGNWGGYFAYEGSETDRLHGLGRIVEPRTNRMVVFSAGVRHSILSIANDAKESRTALSGFFVRKRHAETMLSRFAKEMARAAS